MFYAANDRAILAEEVGSESTVPFAAIAPSSEQNPSPVSGQVCLQGANWQTPIALLSGS